MVKPILDKNDVSFNDFNNQNWAKKLAWWESGTPENSLSRRFFSADCSHKVWPNLFHFNEMQSFKLFKTKINFQFLEVLYYKGFGKIIFYLYNGIRIIRSTIK